MQPATVDLRAVFDAHAPFVWRVVRHLGVDSRDVEDVAQEVFVVCHRRLASFDPDGPGSLRSWLYAICTNVVRNHRRRAYVRREHPTAELPEVGSQPSPEVEVGRRRRMERLQHMLAALSEEQRTVVVLHEIEGWTMKEITASLGVPLQTGYSRLRAARKALQEMLARQERQEESA